MTYCPASAYKALSFSDLSVLVHSVLKRGILKATKKRYQAASQFEERFSQVLACLYWEKLSERSGLDKGVWKAGSVVTLTSFANKSQQ